MSPSSKSIKHEVQHLRNKIPNYTNHQISLIHAHQDNTQKIGSKITKNQKIKSKNINKNGKHKRRASSSLIQHAQYEIH